MSFLSTEVEPRLSEMEKEPSRTSARTRQAILDAAAGVLARNPAASMSEIGDVARTARSTVHRHFPERADLLAALQAHAETVLADAATRARLNEGPAAEALLRLCTQYFESGDVLMGAYGGLGQAEELDSMEAMDGDLLTLVTRGHEDGSIDPALTPVWIQQTLWSLLYAAWLMAAAGQSSRHEALSLFLMSFRKMLAR